jgi:hypothetical protein
MAFSQDQHEIIMRAIKTKTAMFAGGCTFCRQNTWTLADGLVVVSLLPGPPVPHFPMEYVTPPPYLPTVALVCSTCGHTELFNLMTLGLGAIVGILPEGQAHG